ncbi:guanine nucleotide-binding protein-like 1 [Tubulanus polymorphus]|uniref:guanine nucleotide-binding protein-like 1 n=1 Tax=Tubulanus polymorphus TaxID=672921 RepID=UPI003DA5CBBE
MPPHRKKPFSSKLKKKQLKEKRASKRDDGHKGPIKKHMYRGLTDSEDNDSDNSIDVKKVNLQPQTKSDKRYDPNRYRLHFLHETKEELEKRKRRAYEPFSVLSDTALELDVDTIYQPGTVLDMPKRPTWNFNLSKEKLDDREEKYFKEYLDGIFDKHSPEELSYFEVNLETWRQLWRVLEMSDIVLLITDIRHPALHFSPALYNHVTRDLGKHIVLVLNKIDLAPPGLVIAWKHYFRKCYPEIHIICFTSYPQDFKNSEKEEKDPGKVLHKKRRRGHYVAIGPRQLWQACDNIVKDQVDLSSWQDKIELEIAGENVAESEVVQEEDDGDYLQKERYKDGILTIGCVGYPNVGKSTLINGLVGKKVVSVSRTPGHTKHFQTIFLTPKVKMCDCPGLVFPSLVAKPLQILAGIYPVAQVREPYSAVQFLAERIPVIKLLQLTHPEASEQKGANIQWSSFDICDAWAEKRGFLTAKAARNDTYRAANNILRMALDGRLCLCMRPPGYSEKIDEWHEHPEAAQVLEWQRAIIGNKSDDIISEGSTTEGSDFGEEADNASSESSASDENNTATTSNPFALLADD